jgi:hypothetical protein
VVVRPEFSETHSRSISTPGTRPANVAEIKFVGVRSSNSESRLLGVAMEQGQSYILYSLSTYLSIIYLITMKDGIPTLQGIILLLTHLVISELP